MRPLAEWEPVFEGILHGKMRDDPAHDLLHVRRVVRTAMKLAAEEGARTEIVFPAAWFHDCVAVSKSSPERSRASQLAAKKAAELLTTAGYETGNLAEIQHAIEAHSFSAGIAPRSIEAQVVQDADRLDALGAIGIARCISTGTSMCRPLYHQHDPFCESRTPDDLSASLDHFRTKLLGLAETMHTRSGREEAHRRTDFMTLYLEQLESEIQPAG